MPLKWESSPFWVEIPLLFAEKAVLQSCAAMSASVTCSTVEFPALDFWARIVVKCGELKNRKGN
jgi:hypothetical protein